MSVQMHPDGTHDRRSQPSSWSMPSTREGWWAVVLSVAAVLLGVLGEVARGEVEGPFYRVAFLIGIVAVMEALLAIHRGERSIVSMLAFVPAAVIFGFGISQLFG